MKKLKSMLSLKIAALFSMAKNYYLEVAQKYDLYNLLVSGKKNTCSDTVTLNFAGGNNKVLESNVEVKHCVDHEDKMFLTVTINKKNQRNFKFQLKYDSLIPSPYFRFDSVGGSHWVKTDGVKLNRQQITTPHFHKYNSEGYEIAYKTAHLEDEETAKALEDIQLCFIHFCHESNTRCSQESFPVIEVMPDTLGIQIFEEDPNQNIDFL